MEGFPVPLSQPMGTNKPLTHSRNLGCLDHEASAKGQDGQDMQILTASANDRVRWSPGPWTKVEGFTSLTPDETRGGSDPSPLRLDTEWRGVIHKRSTICRWIHTGYAFGDPTSLGAFGESGLSFQLLSASSSLLSCPSCFPCLPCPSREHGKRTPAQPAQAAPAPAAKPVSRARMARPKIPQVQCPLLG